VGDLTERDASREALQRDSLPIGGIGPALVVGAVGDAPPTPAPFARVRVAVEPSGTDAALDLLAVQSPEGFVERSAAVLADEDRGFRIRCDRRSLHPWVADG
jgi:hypothetical protein